MSCGWMRASWSLWPAGYCGGNGGIDGWSRRNGPGLRTSQRDTSRLREPFCAPPEQVTGAEHRPRL